MSEKPSERGVVSSAGVITLDAGGTATFAASVVRPENPGDWREFPSATGAVYPVGTRVLCKTSAGAALLVLRDPYTPPVRK